MQGRLRWYIVLFVAVALAALGLFFYSGAHAQTPGGYDCEITLSPDGAVSGQCVLSEPEEPPATPTQTAQPTETPTQTPRATAIPATATPKPTNTATSTPTAAPPTPTAGALTLAVLGDSFYDEYRANDNRGGQYAATTFNLVELLQRLRGVDLGPWGTWGEPRRTGYEFNWARSGATSATLLQQGQHTGAAAQIRAGRVRCVLIGIGANDYSPSFGDTYRRIYSGALAGAELAAKERQHVTDVTTAVDAVTDAGSPCVMVVLFTQWGLDPSISRAFPDAAGRQRVDDSIARVNAGISAMAASRGAAVIDQNAIGAQRILPQLDSAGNLTVGGEKISFLTNGDEPHHVKLADGSHTGTVLSGLLANYYIIETLARFGYDIAPLTDAEILSAAGIRAGPTPTSAAPTATPRPTNTPTSTATAQPPTATPVAAVTPTPMTALRLNVPLTDAQTGAPELDANNRAILSAGDISPDGGYTQVRLVGAADGLRVYSQQMVPTLTGARFVLNVNGRTYTVTPSTAGWTTANRCGGEGCRGWTATRVIPWADLGGKPAEGDAWPLSLSVEGDAWAGALHWGLPDYAGRSVAGARVQSVQLSADASLGGGTDCAADDDPNSGRVSSFFAEWGSSNVGISGSKLVSLGSIPYTNVQAQWDVADWPCYARYAAKWPVSLPDGAQVVSATLNLYKFGHSGYAGEPTGVNVIQVWEASPDWDEAAVSWDNGPEVRENVSRLPVGECAVANCATGEWHAFDVTEIVRRAVERGDAEAAALLYTAAGQYHSGRYFYTREGAVKPVVRIAYTLEGQPAWTAVASPTTSSTPTATSAPTTPTPTLTAGSTPTAPSSPTPAASMTPTSTPVNGSGVTGCTRTASPGGLAAAVAALKAGDTLCLRDGTYTETIEPRTNGTASAPITIRALNDGKAIIDGQGVRRPVQLGTNNQAVGDWFVIEGLVLRNGTDAVLHVRADNNVIRRVSVYDADTNLNSAPLLLWGSGNTVEDCIVGGAGRFMVNVYGGGGVAANGNTVRRCFVKWTGWEGKSFCGIHWPGVFGMGAYNSSGGTFENNIIYGRMLYNFIIQANTSSASASNNAVLGNISLLAGKDYDGSLWRYGSPTWPKLTRPQPTRDAVDGRSCDTSVADLSWAGQRAGIKLFGQGTLANNVFRDNLAADNAGLGFHYSNPGGGRYSGNVIDHMTLVGNGSDSPTADGGKGAQAIFPPGVACTNCRIGSSSSGDGSGARLGRYVDRQATGAPLLPWPMESRAVSELGVSINAIIEEYARR